MANKRNTKKQNNPRKWSGWFYFFLFLALMAGMYFAPHGDESVQKDLSYTKFTAYIEQNMVEKVVVYDDNKAKAVIREESYGIVFGSAEAGRKKKGELVALVPSVEEFSKYLDRVNHDRKFAGMPQLDVSYEKSHDYWYLILVNVLPIALIFLFFIWMGRGLGGGRAGGIFGVGKAQAQIFDKGKKDKVTFKDVAGLAGAKEEVQEIVSFLKDPKKYTELGGKIPKGALLVGPPGTGKTLLAKAVAGEADVPFFSMSGSDFVEMFVGVGASRVRDLFRQAKEKAPAIIFIDEIDAVGRARGKNVMTGGNDERESTLNQLLTEMDGFGTNSGVIILAATNRADVLDPALLRAGRFDRQIHVELPDLHERREIFAVHLQPIKTDESLDIDFLAKQTPGFSGADIANVCNEAALIAARNGHKKVNKQDFMDAVDRIIGGLERKNKIMTEEEKRSIAYHEAGHATISWLLKYANPLVKVTIVPRGMALGAAWYLPEERQLTNKEHLLDEMCSLLGGRAAEELFLGQTSTGALNDLERATKQAYAMVAYYGMSDKLKNMSFYDSTGRYDYGLTKPYSDKTADIIDQESQAIISEQMERAKKILDEHKEGHNTLAELLVEREVITHEDVERILGPRPWKSRGDEIIEANGNVEVAKPKRRSRKKVETAVLLLVAMLSLTACHQEAVKPKVYGRYVPERKDDFAWENEYAAFRMYGPALKPENPSNGVDLWLKSSPELVVDSFYYREHVLGLPYHINYGKGLDCYKVGHTCGAGGLVVIADNKTYVGGPYDRWEILEQTPEKLVFKLEYDSLLVAGHVLQETIIITAEAGEPMNRADVVLSEKLIVKSEELLPELLVGGGIYMHDTIDHFEVYDKIGTVFYEEDALSDKQAAKMNYEHNGSTSQGRIYLTVRTPDATVTDIQDGNLVAVRPYELGDTLTYYFGASWSEWKGIEN